MIKKLELIDFLRGWSICAIVLFHLCGMINIPSIVKTASNFGGADVHVFILCSVFGLFLSHLSKPLGFGNFMKKRLLRVHLPFVIIAIISFFTPFYIGSYDWHALSANLFLYKMFIPEYNEAFGGQMWFVSMIVQFYIILLIIVYLYKRLEGGIFIISLLVSNLYALFVAYIDKSDIRVWNSFFLQYLWEFVLGMWIADLYSKYHSKILIP